MGKPSAPTPTPPEQTAAAQTGQNVTTAIANQMMGNVNQKTPWGDLTYNQTGMYQMTDPNSGEVYDVPLWEAIQSLSPDQQAILDSQNDASKNLSELAANQTSRLDDLLSDPLDTSGLGDRKSVGDIALPELQGYGAAPTLTDTLTGVPEVTTTFDKGAIQNSVKTPENYVKGVNAPGLQSTVTATGAQNGVLGNAGPIQSGVNFNTVGADLNAGQVQTGFDPVGGIQRNVNAPEIRDVTAPGQVKYNGPDIGNLKAGPIDGTIGAPSQGVQYGFDKTSGDVKYDFGNTKGGIQYGYGGDFSDERDEVQQALFDRMQPLADRDLANLEARLASQGIGYGAEMYDDAMDDYNRGQNDARLGAILNAGQEQTRLVNMERDRAVFNNNAQQQDYMQKYQRTILNNQAQLQEYQQEYQRALLNNSANAQEWGQKVQEAQHSLNAQQQEYNQMANNFGLGLQGAGLDLQAQQINAENQARSEQTGINRDIASVEAALGVGRFANEAQAQQHGQSREQFEAHNSGVGQQFGQDLATAQFGTANQNTNNENKLAAAQFGNNAQAQAFAQMLAGGEFENDASTQALLNAIAGGDFANRAQGQEFEQGMANADLNNDILSQIFGQDLAAGEFGNNAQAQDFAQQLAQLTAGNDAQGQIFDQAMAEALLGNSTGQQSFENDQTLIDRLNAISQQDYANATGQVGAENAERDAELNELLMLRNQPINEIAALLGGSQVQSPNFVNTNAGQMPTTDIAGLIANADAQEMANWQAQMQSRQSLLGGLLGLGSGALMGGYI